MNASVRTLPLLLLIAAGLLVAQYANAQTSVATNPVGYVNVTIKSGFTGAVSLPLQGSPAYTGTVSGISYASGTSTITGSSANWTTTYGPFSSNPYIVQMLSGTSTGQYFKIAANTTTTLSVSGSNLTSQVAVGDQFSIVPLDTLGSLFGANAATTGFNVGSDASTADSVLIRGAFGWLTYFNNGTNWLREADGTQTPQNSVPLYPEQGFLVVRQPSTDLTLTVMGNVPTTSLVTNLPSGSTTFLANRFPLDTTIGALALNTYPQWLAGSDASTADSILVRGSFGWLTYFYNGTNWLREADGTQTPQSGVTIPAGSAVLVVRQSGTNLSLNQTLPYTP